MFRNLVTAMMFTVALGLFAGDVAFSQTESVGKKPAAQEKEKKEEKPTGDPYLLDHCPVSGEKLGSMGDPVSYVHEGREVRFCCDNCLPKFKKEPAKYLEKIDKELIAQQLPHYPLKTCMVSGEALGGEDMGEPINHIYGNRLVRFCCRMCTKDFAKEPKKFMEKLDAAVIAAQTPGYPLDKCVVSGKDLGSMGEPANLVIGNRLIRFCCGGCEGKVKANPSKYFALLDAAAKGAKKKSE